MSETIKNNISLISLVTIASISLMVMLHYMKPVLVPFVFSIFLYFIVSPATDWIQTNLKLPRVFAVVISFFFLIAFFSVFISILASSISGFIQSSGIYQAQLLRLFDEVLVTLTQMGFTLDLSIIRKFLTSLPVLDWFRNVSGSIVVIIGNILLVLIFTFFLIIGEVKQSANSVFSGEVRQKITRYIMVKFFTSSLTGLFVFIVLTAFRLELASTFAVLTFLFNFIPNIGSIIALSLPIPIAFLQFGIGIPFILVIVIPGIIQFAIGNILDPKLMGASLGLHPVVVLLSLLFWGFIWGIAGLFLSVPMTAVLKLLFERSSYTQRLARLMEGYLY